jgi:hypothetical protein
MLDDQQDLATVERRMAAVTSVHQVVQLIWLIARSQLPDVEAAAADAGTYVDWVDATICRLAGEPELAEPGAALHVVFGPERGYCGGLTREVIGGLPPEGHLGIVGRHLLERATADDIDRAARIRFTVPGPASAFEHEAVAYDVARAILEHAGDAPVVVHYPSVDADGLVQRHILSGGRRVVRDPPETFSPVSTTLEIGVRELVMGRLAVAAIETLRAEVRARVAASDRARTGCDRRLEELRGDLAVVRQSQVTSELLEIVAGHLTTR